MHPGPFTQLVQSALLLCAPSVQHTAGPAVLEPDALREDLGLFQHALESAHPALRRYATEEELEAAFDAAWALADEPHTVVELECALARVVSVVGCGHTRVSPPRTERERRRRELLCLPLELAFLGGRAYVLADFGEEPSIPAGSELVALDGRPMAELVEETLALLSGDGRIRTGRLEELGRSLPEWHALLHGGGQSLVSARTPAGETLEIRRDGLPLGELQRLRAERTREPDRPALSFEVTEESVGLLTIRSFGGGVADAEGHGYESFLATSFASLAEAGARSLVIDLRQNGGGSDVYGAMLLAHLVQEPFRYYDRLEVVLRELDFREHAVLPADVEEALAGEMSEAGNGARLYTAHPNLAPIQPRAPRFAGPVFVLIDGGSFSATAEFAANAHELGRCVFVGEETGGGYHGNTSGPELVLTLPRSGVHVNVPLWKYVMAVEGSPEVPRGILPDHEVAPSIEDVLAGRDPALARALELARTGG